MATLTEDYVSLETAKLLKEKGFDIPVWTYYENDDYEIVIDNEIIFGSTRNWNNSSTRYISAPTQAMVMKWLREEHNIAINIGWGEIFEDKFQWWCIILNYKDGSILRESEYYATYEEAAEAAIKYCLEENLI